MKVSDFLLQDNIPPFLLGAFYGRFEFTENSSIIYTYSSYRNWTKIFDNPNLCAESKVTFLKQLNDISAPFSFWTKGSPLFPRADIAFALENDLNLSKDNFFNRLNRKIITSDFIYDDSFSEDKKMFIRGFSELRASIDRTRHLLTMDYIKNIDA